MFKNNCKVPTYYDQDCRSSQVNDVLYYSECSGQYIVKIS